MKLPIGYDDFGEIIRRQLDYVDKTLFIQEILDSVSQVTLITRPRRFGKSLNLSMLQYFFAAQVIGQPTQGLFDGLKIAALGEKYMQHQGQYPVIALNLKDVKNLNFETAYQKLTILMGNTYAEHDYLLASPHLSPRDKEFYQKILSRKAQIADFEVSLNALVQYLFKHHGVKPWLLIDEYDIPMQSAYVYGYYEPMVSLMRGLLGATLKSNHCLERAVLTGIVRVSKESLFSGLNNLEVCSIFTSKYEEYFGFTEQEVLDLLEKSHLNHLSEKIRHWYNGYRVGETTIYNPWSMANCINNQGQIKPYWLNTSDNALVNQLLARGDDQLKMQLESLIHNESITALIDESIVFGDLEKNADAIWSLLVITGYLKVIHIEQKDSQIQCELTIPNQEVFSLYRTMVQRWMADRLGHEKYLVFLLSLTEGRVEEFTQRLQKYLLETASVFDVSGTEPERFYHGFVLGMMISLSETHEVQSNRESGYGRYDVMLIPKDLEQLGIILEFKTVREPSANLQQAAEQAIQQITQRQYEATLKQKGIQNILKLGLAFRGKQVEVAATAPVYSVQ